jgi:hypothetical protein
MRDSHLEGEVATGVEGDHDDVIDAGINMGNNDLMKQR